MSSVNQTDAKGWTALMIAARHGSTQQVQSLLNRGADPTIEADHRMTALIISRYYNPGVTNTLLQAVDPDAFDATLTPMFHAAQHGTPQHVQDAISAGDSLHRSISHDRTPLDVAAMHASPDVVRALLAAGADAHLNLPGTPTPLMRAAEANRPDNTKALLEYNPDTTETDRQGATALHYAAEFADTTTIKHLLHYNAEIDAQDDWGRTPLAIAAAYGTPATIEALIKAGANPQHKDSEGRTIFGHAALTGTPQNIVFLSKNGTTQTELNLGLYELAQQHGQPASMLALLELGADPTTTGRYGETAFIHAAFRGNPKTIRGIAKYTAPQNELDEALSDLANSTDNPQAIPVLLELGANPNTKNEAGQTPLTTAKARDDHQTIKHLLEYGAT